MMPDNKASSDKLDKYELAYLAWKNMGFNRTASAIASQFGVSNNAVSQWRKKYKWDERLNNELKQVAATIKQEVDERALAGCRFYVQATDQVVQKWLTDILTDKRQVSDETILKLIELSAEMQTGRYKANNDDKDTIKKTDHNIELMNKILHQVGDVIVDDYKQKQQVL